MNKPLLGSVALLFAATLTLTGCGQLQNLANGGGDTAVRDDTTSEITDAGDIDVFTLAVGDCFNDVDTAEEISSLPVVPCSDSHDNEVFYEFTLPDGDLPAASEIDDAVLENCAPAFASFVGMTYEESTLDYWDIRPTQEGWDSIGDRVVQCAIFDPAGPVTGTLAGAQR
ncbi:MAG: septum formation family protein [Pseudorhodoferax sp.]